MASTKASAEGQQKGIVDGEKKPLTAESVEATLRHFAENGGLQLNAYFESAGRQLPCTIDKAWDVHGVTVTEKELSFIASKDGKTPMKFFVTFAALVESAKRWFEEIANKLKAGADMLKEAIIPPEIVFHAGVTEFVAGKKPAAA